MDGLQAFAPDAEVAARRAFHAALPFGFLPGVSVLVTLWFAWRGGAFRREADRWALRLRGLLAADLLVVASVALFGLASLRDLDRSRSAPRVKIGIMTAPAADGVRVAQAEAGSPAGRAGLESGDVIEAIDGKRVRAREELAAEIGGGGARERLLQVRRGDRVLRLAVTPEAVEAEDAPAPAPIRWGGRVLSNWAQIVFTLVGLAACAWRARRKRVTPLPAALFAGALGLASTLTLWIGAAFKGARGGASPGSWLALVLSFTLLNLAASAAALWIAVRRRAVPAPEWEVPPAGIVARGMLYAFTLGARAALICLPLSILRDVQRVLPAGDPLAPARALPHQASLLFLGIAIVIAPLAEELLFRGLLLPWLERLFSPASALWLSAAFFALQHLAYGPGAAFILVVGLVLGWARQRTGGLSAPLFIHTACNGLMLLVQLAARRWA
ncbi:MAG TPA: CPBP family glutamic-type intramembrane protease [Myxococcales bacterium]